MNNNRSIQKLLGALVIASLMVLTGCQSMGPMSIANPFKMSENVEPEEVVFQQPARMAVIWKESAVAPPGQQTTRGFGGRVYFYNEKNESVRVDGELTVFAYDDSTGEDQQARIPDRRYVFKAEDLQKHHGKTSLGDSYSIWLPWDKVGGERKTVALVPIFKPVDGAIPKSDHSIAVLAGKSNSLKEKAKSDSRVRQVAMQVPAGERYHASNLTYVEGLDPATEPAQEKVRTTTFDVPRSLANRMNVASPPPARRKALVPKRGTVAKDGEAARDKAKPLSENVIRESVVTPQKTYNSRPQFGKPGSFR